MPGSKLQFISTTHSFLYLLSVIKGSRRKTLQRELTSLLPMQVRQGLRCYLSYFVLQSTGFIQGIWEEKVPLPGICAWVICLDTFSVLLMSEGDGCLIRELTVF